MGAELVGVLMTAKRPGILQEGCSHCGGTGLVTTVSGAWARQQRLAAGVGLREIARRMGLSVSYLCDGEKGRRPIYPAMWERYKAALAGEKSSGR